MDEVDGSWAASLKAGVRAVDGSGAQSPSFSEEADIAANSQSLKM